MLNDGTFGKGYMHGPAPGAANVHLAIRTAR